MEGLQRKLGLLLGRDTIGLEGVGEPAQGLQVVPGVRAPEHVVAVLRAVQPVDREVAEAVLHLP